MSYTSSLRSLHMHRQGSLLETPGKLWVQEQEIIACVPAEKGGHHGNQAEVGGVTRHPGGAARNQCSARAHRPWRGRVQEVWA